MKPLFYSLLQPLVVPTLVCCLLSSVGAAPPVAAPAARQTQGAARPVKVNASAEAALMAIARQRGVNVLIDSTRIDPSAPVQGLIQATRGLAADVVNVLIPCAEEHHLSSQRLAPNTFVFWAEPDEDKVAQAILQGQGFGEEKGIISHDELLVALRAQLDPQSLKQEAAAAQETIGRPFAAGENGVQIKKLMAAPPPRLEGQLSQLPLEVQQQMVASVIQESLRANPEASNFSELWTRDEVWNRSHIWLRPADPGFGLQAALLVQMQVETPQNRLLVSLSPSDGSMVTKIVRRRFGGPPVPVSSKVEEGQLRVLPLDKTDADPPLILTERLLPAGSGFKSFQVANAKGADLGIEKLLETPVSLEATRRPLADFLRDAGQAANVRLSISPEMKADSLLTSGYVQQMPLAQLMQTVAHTYGAIWAKDDAQSFTLKSAGRSPLEMELLRLGLFRWYRFREAMNSNRERERQEFKAFAAEVFDQAGDALVKPPGIAFTALPVPMQQEFRQRAKESMARRLLQTQSRVRDLLSGELTFRLTGGFIPGLHGSNSSWSYPSLTLLVDGRPRGGITWSAPVDTKATAQMAQAALQPR